MFLLDWTTVNSQTAFYQHGLFFFDALPSVTAKKLEHITIARTFPWCVSVASCPPKIWPPQLRDLPSSPAFYLRETKATRHPLKRPTRGSSFAQPWPGYRMSMDIVGPFRIRSRTHNRYLIHFLDARTGISLPCWYKDRMACKVQAAKCDRAKIIAQLVSDGGVNVGQDVRYCDGRGITQVVAPPYTQTSILSSAW